MDTNHAAMTTLLLKRYNHLQHDFQLVINGKYLDISAVCAVCKNRDIKVAKSDVATAVMKRNASFLQKQIDDGNTIYGVNTGYGGSANVRSKDTHELQNSLIRFMNAGFGETLPSHVIRGVMLIRANSLSLGFSGVRPCVVDQLLGMLNADIVPVVPKRGSVSASGDLMPTSYVAACMAGRPDARVVARGTLTTAASALGEAGMKPQDFRAKEALAVINSSSVAASMAACVLLDANAAVLLTEAVVAMSVEALRGQLESFHGTIHQCMPHEGQIEVADNMRYLLKGSKFASYTPSVCEKDKPGMLKQDRYDLRCAAQWLAPVLETLEQSVHRVNTELNSASDNPLIDHKTAEILHGGNFQGISITTAMDQARQMMQICGKLLFAQMSELVNVQMSGGLPANLAGSDPNTDFGFKGADIAMASYTAELDLLANPVTNHVLSAELNNQSINSLALVSARQSEKALTILQMMLSNILCCQLQAVDLRWLQSQAEVRIADMFNELGVKPVLSQLWPWHMFVLSPEHAARELHEKLFDQDEFGEEMILHQIRLATEGMLERVYSGDCFKDVCLQLGKGTRQLYKFLRQDMGIPFHTGQAPLDTSLEKIFMAIKDHSLDYLLINLFSSDTEEYVADFEKVTLNV